MSCGCDKNKILSSGGNTAVPAPTQTSTTSQTVAQNVSYTPANTVYNSATAPSSAKPAKEVSCCEATNKSPFQPKPQYCSTCAKPSNACGCQKEACAIPAYNILVPIQKPQCEAAVETCPPNFYIENTGSFIMPACDVKVQVFFKCAKQYLYEGARLYNIGVGYLHVDSIDVDGNYAYLVNKCETCNVKAAGQLIQAAIKWGIDNPECNPVVTSTGGGTTCVTDPNTPCQAGDFVVPAIGSTATMTYSGIPSAFSTGAIIQIIHPTEGALEYEVTNIDYVNKVLTLKNNGAGGTIGKLIKANANCTGKCEAPIIVKSQANVCQKDATTNCGQLLICNGDVVEKVKPSFNNAIMVGDAATGKWCQKVLNNVTETDNVCGVAKCLPRLSITNTDGYIIEVEGVDDMIAAAEDAGHYYYAITICDKKYWADISYGIQEVGGKKSIKVKPQFEFDDGEPMGSDSCTECPVCPVECCQQCNPQLDMAEELVEGSLCILAPFATVNGEFFDIWLNQFGFVAKNDTFCKKWYCVDSDIQMSAFPDNDNCIYQYDILLADATQINAPAPRILYTQDGKQDYYFVNPPAGYISTVSMVGSHPAGWTSRQLQKCFALEPGEEKTITYIVRLAVKSKTTPVQVGNASFHFYVRAGVSSQVII